jgi:hypothetical protein
MARVNRGGPTYDVCLSFAGEQRAYVEKVAQALQERGVRVFYDVYERATLWGKDLPTHLLNRNYATGQFRTPELR